MSSASSPSLLRREGIVVYERTSHSSNIRTLKQYHASQRSSAGVNLTQKLTSTIPDSSYSKLLQMNRQQTSKRLSYFYYYYYYHHHHHGWMRGTLVCKSSLSPLLIGSIEYSTPRESPSSSSPKLGEEHKTHHMNGTLDIACFGIKASPGSQNQFKASFFNQPPLANHIWALSGDIFEHNR